MNDHDALNLALLIARLWIGGDDLRPRLPAPEGDPQRPGMANWFESLGLRNGQLQAMNVTYTELVFGPRSWSASSPRCRTAVRRRSCSWRW